MVLHNLILLPFLTSILLLSLSEKKNMHLIKKISLFSACLTFIFSLWIICFFDKMSLKFQYTFYFNWFFSTRVYFGLDGISVFLILLVAFITFFCILVALRRKAGVKYMLIYIFLIEFFCLVVFTVLDLLVFYMFFESVLMPMFVMIGIWGSTYVGRVKAGYYFFLYTLAGSVLFLWAIMLIYLETGTTSMLILLNTDFSQKKQLLLFCFTFLGFAVKIPLFPLHI
jgi:NADH-ubiquinone oxidoreductase chain 4